MEPSLIIASFLFGLVVYFVIFFILAKIDERRSLRREEEIRRNEYEKEATWRHPWETDPDAWKDGLDPWDKKDSDGDPLREPSPTE